MNKVDSIVREYLKSDKPIDDFLETIESTDIDVTPEKSPYPSGYKKNKDKDDEDDIK